MRGFLTGLSKLVAGVILALMLFSLAGVATARYFMAKLSVLPPKPIFDNDAPALRGTPDTPSTPTVAATAETPEPEPEPAPTPAATPDLPPGSYGAVVSQPIGLVLRAGPGTEYDRLGGVDNNVPVTVLKTSEDGEWLNIRVTATGQEGWIKGGNTRREATPTPVQ
jgi:uncharacterized protein YgiM (DUF1202 family)